MPLGPGVDEVVTIIVHDIRECAAFKDNDKCQKQQSYDGYEESKMKAMTHEEMKVYAKKLNGG